MNLLKIQVSYLTISIQYLRTKQDAAQGCFPHQAQQHLPHCILALSLWYKTRTQRFYKANSKHYMYFALTQS